MKRYKNIHRLDQKKGWRQNWPRFKYLRSTIYGETVSKNISILSFDNENHRWLDEITDTEGIEMQRGNKEQWSSSRLLKAAREHSCGSRKLYCSGCATPESYSSFHITSFADKSCFDDDHEIKIKWSYRIITLKINWWKNRIFYIKWKRKIMLFEKMTENMLFEKI